jgi:hypothetical protein
MVLEHLVDLAERLAVTVARAPVRSASARSAGALEWGVSHAWEHRDALGCRNEGRQRTRDSDVMR